VVWTINHPPKWDIETTLFAEFIDFQEVYSIFQDFLLVENATKKFQDFPVPLI